MKKILNYRNLKDEVFITQKTSAITVIIKPDVLCYQKPKKLSCSFNSFVRRRYNLSLGFQLNRHVLITHNAQESTEYFMSSSEKKHTFQTADLINKSRLDQLF